MATVATARPEAAVRLADGNDLLVEDVFEGAAVFVQTASQQHAGDVPQATMLRLYGLYKQATEGDVRSRAPSVFSLDMKAKAKWHAWSQQKGKGQHAAMREYVDLVDETFPGFSPEAPQQGSGAGPAAPAQSTLAGAQRAEASQAAESLHHFAGQGDAAAVQARLGGGADVNARDGDGATPLHWAADRGDAAMVELLLARGADVAACDGEGMTSLHYAALSGREQAARVLVAAGASVGATDADGNTARALAPSWTFWQDAGT